MKVSEETSIYFVVTKTGVSRDEAKMQLAKNNWDFEEAVVSIRHEQQIQADRAYRNNYGY